MAQIGNSGMLQAKMEHTIEAMRRAGAQTKPEAAKAKSHELSSADGVRSSIEKASGAVAPEKTEILNGADYTVHVLALVIGIALIPTGGFIIGIPLFLVILTLVTWLSDDSESDFPPTHQKIDLLAKENLSPRTAGPESFKEATGKVAKQLDAEGKAMFHIITGAVPDALEFVFDRATLNGKMYTGKQQTEKDEAMSDMLKQETRNGLRLPEQIFSDFLREISQNSQSLSARDSVRFMNPEVSIHNEDGSHQFSYKRSEHDSELVGRLGRGAGGEALALLNKVKIRNANGVIDVINRAVNPNNETNVQSINKQWETALGACMNQNALNATSGAFAGYLQTKMVINERIGAQLMLSETAPISTTITLSHNQETGAIESAKVKLEFTSDLRFSAISNNQGKDKETHIANFVKTIVEYTIKIEQTENGPRLVITDPSPPNFVINGNASVRANT